jgi:hypothetical protein
MRAKANTWLAALDECGVERPPLCEAEPPPPEGGGFDGRLKSPEDLAGDSGNHSETLKSASSWGSATGSEGGAMLPRQASDGTADERVWHR